MFRIAHGPLLNNVSRGASFLDGEGPVAPGGTSTFDANYPIENLYDGIPAIPGKWSAGSLISGTYDLVFSNNILPDGDMENATSAWEGGAHSALYAYKGSQSNSVATSGMSIQYSSTNYATVKAGEYLKIQAAALVPAGDTGSGRVTVLNSATGEFLNSDGTWGSNGIADGLALTWTAGVGTWTTDSLEFQVQSFEECGKWEVQLQVQLREGNSTTNNYIYYDEVLLIPGFNTWGVVGHGFNNFAVMRLSKPTSGDYWHDSTWDTAGAAMTTVGSPSTAGRFRKQTFLHEDGTMYYEPFLMLSIPTGFSADHGDGFSTGDPYIGEFIVTQMRDFTKNPDFPVGLTRVQPQIRLSSRAGVQWVVNEAEHHIRQLRMSFSFKNDQQYTDTDEVFLASGGRDPVIIIPTEIEPWEHIYGRINQSVDYQRVSQIVRTAEWTLTEDGLPVVRS
jgi:hypothetical protein